MKTSQITFTDAALKKIVYPEKGRSFYTDKRQAGFRVMVTPAGTITFQCRAWSNEHKKPITKTLGKYPSMSITKARKLAADTLQAIQGGKDIEQIRRDKAAEQTLDIIFERYMQEYAKKIKRSWKDDESRFKLYIEKPFGKRKLDEITTDQVRNWHRKLSERVSNATANRALALFRKVYNEQAPKKENPCIGVKQFEEYSRERFLSPSELSRFFAAIEKEPSDTTRHYILLSLFTGARRSNVLAMSWRDIDLDTNIWTIPGEQSKNRAAMKIPLIPEVVNILNERRKKTSSFFVFPGRGKTGHFKEPRKGWLRICKAASLEGVRLHDLRRTMGSYQISSGASTAIVGKTLGHKSTESTMVYARMSTDPVRASMEKAVGLMQSSAAESKKKIVKIGGKDA